MILYHFTSTHPLHLTRILERGALIPTESNVGSVSPKWQPYGERLGPDVVWLTDTPTPELGHGLLGSAVDKTEVRFTVDVRAVKWLDWTFRHAMNRDWFDHFVKNGGGLEAAEHWYVVPAPIYRRRWVTVENVKTGEVIL